MRGGRPSRLEPDRAWEYLLWLLGRRAYTVDELRRKLRRRELDADTAEDLLERLQRLGLADDRAYAERYVSARRGHRGRVALRRELRRKGVAEALVADELVGLDDAQQRAAAVALLGKHAWRYHPDRTATAAHPRGAGAAGGGADGAGGPGDEDARREGRRRARARAFAFLARRGFPADVAAAALEEVGWWDAAQDDGALLP